MEQVRAQDLVLVAIVPSPRDLEIARVLGWYRLPVRSAPKTLRVDWLALYQPGSFEDDRWTIRYIARVLGFELVRRIELLHDEPDHPGAQEPYFKVQLGPLQRLKHGIRAGDWKRFTFLYTTGERIASARRLVDLTLKRPSEQDTLWSR